MRWINASVYRTARNDIQIRIGGRDWAAFNSMVNAGRTRKAAEEAKDMDCTPEHTRTYRKGSYVE